MDIARREIGTTEVPGAGNNPRIIEYHSSCDLRATEDSVAWCSAFVNWCMMKAGIPRTKSAAARSWLNYGRAIDVPQVGCIVIFRRGDPPAGHVAFVESVEGEYLLCLGGNQGDTVKCARFPKKDVLGYRMPL